MGGVVRLAALQQHATKEARQRCGLALSGKTGAVAAQPPCMFNACRRLRAPLLGSRGAAEPVPVGSSACTERRAACSQCENVGMETNMHRRVPAGANAHELTRALAFAWPLTKTGLRYSSPSYPTFSPLVYPDSCTCRDRTQGIRGFGLVVRDRLKSKK